MITDYTTLYQQAKTGNQTGSAVGSSDWLAQNQMAQFTNLAPKPPKPEEDLTGMAMANMNQTLGDVRQSAYQDYMARQLQQLELQKQGAMQGGADRFQQARLAMEQQRGLSDTRGLTAGAAVGAQGQLGAQQQLVLNSIERGTMDDLRQIESQGLSLEFAANEWAQQKVNEFKQTNPAWTNVDAANNALTVASANFDRDPTNPAVKRAYELANIQYYRSLAEVSGMDFDDIILNLEKGMEDNPEDMDLSEYFSDETIQNFQTAQQQSQPRGFEDPSGLGMDAGLVAGAGLIGATAIRGLATSGTQAAAAGKAGLMGGSTFPKIAKWASDAAQASKVVSSKIGVKGLSKGALQALNVGQGTKSVTLTAAKIGKIKSTATLTSIGKQLGISAKALTNAKTAAGLQKLILGKIGVAGKGSLLAGKLAVLGKGALAVAAAKPLLVIAAIGATIWVGNMAYQAAKRHFGPEVAKEKLTETLMTDREMMIAEGMDEETANAITQAFVSQFPDIDLG